MWNLELMITRKQGTQRRPGTEHWAPRTTVRTERSCLAKLLCQETSYAVHFSKKALSCAPRRLRAVGQINQELWTRTSH